MRGLPAFSLMFLLASAVAAQTTESSAMSRPTAMTPIIKWAKPYWMPGYSASHYRTMPLENGISLRVEQNGEAGAGLPEGIQVIANTPIILEVGREYSIVFESRSSAAGRLVARFGDRFLEKGESFDSAGFDLDGSLQWQSQRKPFTAVVKKNFLYLQFGAVEPGTDVTIRRMRFVRSDDDSATSNPTER